MAPSNSASPAPEASSSTSSVVPAKTTAPPLPKPANIFSSDGSFLSRMKASNPKGLTPAEKEKEEREKALARKKAMEDRFKKRGKRAAEPTDESSSKKAKGDEELTAYEKEVKRLNNSTLKDSGYDMRPMLK